MRILVCGGRDFGEPRPGVKSNPEAARERQIAFEAMEKLFARYGQDVEIVQGGAAGADSLAHEWAMRREVASITEPARWAEDGKWAAGPRRNQRMLDKWKPDAGVAFPGGRGTADMVQRMKDAGLKVWEVKA